MAIRALGTPEVARVARVNRGRPARYEPGLLAEFLNHHVLSWLQRRVRPVFMTRSRPYKKDDNAHVEQKNRMHIRQGFGYERHDNSEAVELMNELARGPYRQLLNYFHADCQVLICAIRGVPRELPEAGRVRMNASTDRTSDERAGFARRG